MSGVAAAMREVQRLRKTGCLGGGSLQCPDSH